MSSNDAALAPARLGKSQLVLPVFAAALFVSATLMFEVQPMFTRMVLPVLGGSPGVWSVAMVFFQAMLLAGYFYAHILTRHVPMRTAALVHVTVMALALLGLPIARASGFAQPPETGAAFWLIGLFGASVGLPFFALAGNGPLLQAWFARSGHKQADDPYFLYGASNLGSFAGLLLYPALIEPTLRLAQQSQLWTYGFLVLGGLIAAASLLAIKRGSDVATAASNARAPALATPQVLRFVGLAFVPSGLLVAVTAQLSTDVAAAPLLWVLPLALFLLTFVLAFRDRPLLPHGWMLALQPWLMGASLILVANTSLFNMFAAIGLMLANYFVCAMVAHGQLFKLRPPASQLTGFYLWMSVGGVLGGIFAALLAPLMFSTILEYPILLILALLCRPSGGLGRLWQKDCVYLVLAALLLATPSLLGLAQLPDEFGLARFLLAVALALGIVLVARNKGMLVGLTAATLILVLAWQTGSGRTWAVRSFFGVHKIVDSSDGRVRLLFHGTTIHGAERLKNEDGTPATGIPEKLTYYFDGGAMVEAISTARAAQAGLADVAVVGLGAGSLACAAAPGENWRFFEIDPEIIRIARDPQKFRFLDACQAKADIIAGDARLTLAADPRRYDLIVLDAFSSDSIPVHLLTVEALQLYVAHLKPHGSLVMHITNRNMQLADVVASVAQKAGLVAWIGRDTGELSFATDFHGRAVIAAVARSDADLGALPGNARWSRMVADPAVQPWSDDYSNIVQAIWRRLIGA